MKTSMFGILVLSMSVAGAASQNDKSDAEKFRGTWRVVSVERDGETEFEKKDKPFYFSFDNGKMTMKAGKKTLEASTFKIDPSKSPKEIDLFTGKTGKDHAKGIYVFEGDQLKICLSALPPRPAEKDDIPNVSKDRPTEFTAKKDQMRFLFVLIRDKP